MEKDLGEARLLVGQYEAKMKSLNESIKDLDGKKRSLEEQVDTLNEDVSKLKAAEQMHQVASEERQEEMQMRTALEQQISQVTTHMWLMGCPNPNNMEQTWECIFLNTFTHIKTK